MTICKRCGMPVGEWCICKELDKADRKNRKEKKKLDKSH
jgi:hypothetical protein